MAGAWSSLECKEQYQCLCAVVLDEVLGLYLDTSAGTAVAVNVTTAHCNGGSVFFGVCIVIHICNENQLNAHFLC
jgi:hypothetical protein